jgi:hypothetical protein
MLLTRDAAGHRVQALQLLDEALTLFQDIGMKRDVEEALKLKVKAQGIDLTDIGTSIDTVARGALAEQPDLRPHAAPDGTVTIMFSDIEGSTAMADRLGDTKFMEVLREHNAIVRKQIKAHNGFEVKSEGDAPWPSSRLSMPATLISLSTLNCQLSTPTSPCTSASAYTPARSSKKAKTSSAATSSWRRGWLRKRTGARYSRQPW